MALPENWTDGVGQQVDAAFLNQLGSEHNAMQDALDGKSILVITQQDYDELGSPDPDTIYVVIE
ncbi:hypothetical protein Gompeii16_34 [Mycobacterium phage Gompeii16]|uniref:hypothetical protein n=1 Tax=Mycobacterium phage Gompeii16 TaxID=1873895 RepID=UPI000810FFD5|nr:hypothetical protein Gompeii16_34 [Mycobacterium phage Gompeii16]ANU79453.1 hypothetical protein Gompeii16_34 [Mycobacterium phage Gompeii16]ANU79542.1 hypothetical protein SEA_BIRCSAK_34 [Mycobacterium phage Bircsak]QGJ87927.1 hypothetical protein SEA_KILLIGREW_32 [Mycobacterium phage Killigrew]